MSFIKTMQEYIDAAFPILYVRTHEEDRVLGDLARLDGVKSVWRWSTPAGGWRPLKGEFQPVKTDGALGAVAAIATMPDDSVYCLLDYHAALGPGSRALRDALPGYKRLHKTIVIISPVQSIPIELEKEIVLVPFNAPDRAELGIILDRVCTAAAASAGGAVPVIADRAALIEAARSLTEAEAESTFSLALVRHGDFRSDAVTTVRNEKALAIRKTNLVKWVLPSVSIADVGGLGRLKRYAKTIAPIFHHPDKAEAFGLLPGDFPRSIAIIGMPGCGKSLTAEALSLLLRIGCVRTDFSTIFSAGEGRAGAAEGNIAARNALVESMAPVEDWWDEAEKGLGGIGGASKANPWEARVGGSLLTWFEEYRAPILTVATINKHEMMPPEMLSRFQKTFFVDFPTYDERVEIVRIHLLARRLGELAETAASALADCTDGFNGREIRNVIQMSMQQAFSHGLTSVSLDLLRTVAKTVTPLSRSRADELKAIRQWAQDNDIEDASGVDAIEDASCAPARRIVTRRR
jgi:SpoVK/Ycf46/Vps4 family AAA+-type ATPase